MDSVQSSEVVDECVNSQAKRPLDGVKRKRGYSQTLCDTDQTPPQKKVTPCDVLETEAGQQFNNGNVETGRNQDANANHFSLEHFCDEVLYEIIKFLDTWTLITLMNVSQRFQKFVLDKRLWEAINLSQKPLPLRVLENMLERTHEKTQSIKFMGPSPSQPIESEIRQFNLTLRNSLTTRCTKLAVMELFGVTLDFNELTFKEFPASLKRLVINNCNVRSPIFHGFYSILPNLEELAIEENAWLDPYFIMAIAQLPNLKYLSLKGCSQMKDFIAYGSIAGRYGFKQLEILDLRETPLDNSDLQSFNAVRTLKEIYLQRPEVVIKAQTENPIYNNMPTTTSSQANQWENAPTSTEIKIKLINAEFSDFSKKRSIFSSAISAVKRSVLFYANIENASTSASTSKDCRVNIKNCSDTESLHPTSPESAVEASVALPSNCSMPSFAAVGIDQPSSSANSYSSWGNISDMGVCGFGRTRVPVQRGIVCIGFDNRPMENRFERFSVRGYKHVTDTSLEHLVQCSPNLVFLDVSGTSVTIKGIRRFKELKPECKVVAEHLFAVSFGS